MEAWLTTGHSRHVRDLSQPGATSANFAANPAINPADLKFAIGGLTKQYFVDQNWKYIGSSWNQEKKQWEDASSLKGADYLDRCAGCHSVGYNKEARTVVSFNISCESCHGVGAKHVAGGGDKTQIKVSLSNDVCGTCHGGQKAELESMGHTTHFSNLLDQPYYKDACTKCHSATVIRAIREGKTPPTLADFRTGALKDDRLGITCTVCHSPHKKTNEAQLRKPVEEVCIQCHTADVEKINAGDTVHHAQKEFFEGTAGFGVPAIPAAKTATCVDCHMKSVSGDGKEYVKHDFKPRVDAEIDDKGKKVVVSACAQCHTSMTREKVESIKKDFEERYHQADTELKALKARMDTITKQGGTLDPAIDTLYKEAYTNLTLIEAGKMPGVHNPAFAEGLFKAINDRIAQLKLRLP